MGTPPVADQRHELAVLGERIAEKHLRRAGYKLLARRFSAPVGEIDLVMRAGQTLVFVEVKTQRDERFGFAVDRLTSAKRRRLIRAARCYVSQLRGPAPPCRFDLVTVIVPADGSEPRVTHYPDAFAPERW